MSGRRTVSHDKLMIKSGDRAAICDWCERPFQPSELRWICEDWISTRGDRGHVTATLCPECERLALSHCWRCGGLTGRPDGVCARCEEL